MVSLLDGGGRLVRKRPWQTWRLFWEAIASGRPGLIHSMPLWQPSWAGLGKEGGLAACPAAKVPARVQSVILDAVGSLSTEQDSETIKFFIKIILHLHFFCPLPTVVFGKAKWGYVSFLSL